MMADLRKGDGPGVEVFGLNGLRYIENPIFAVRHLDALDGENAILRPQASHPMRAEDDIGDAQ